MASAVLPVPMHGSGGFDGGDGNESDSHSEDEGNEEQPKKAVFVRCPLCRNSKEMVRHSLCFRTCQARKPFMSLATSDKVSKIEKQFRFQN